MAITLAHKFVSLIPDGSTTYVGTFTSGSNQITGVTPAPAIGMVGFKLFGSAIPTETTISTVVGTTITMSANASSSSAGGTFYTGDGQIQPLDWNDQHTLSMATNTLLGRSTAATGPAEEIGIGAGLSLSAGQLLSTGATTGKAIAMAIVFGG